jgi:hypothetical protein
LDLSGKQKQPAPNGTREPKRLFRRGKKETRFGRKHEEKGKMGSLKGCQIDGALDMDVRESPRRPSIW